jgi:hypothetical protein
MLEHSLKSRELEDLIDKTIVPISIKGDHRKPQNTLVRINQYFTILEEDLDNLAREGLEREKRLDVEKHKCEIHNNFKNDTEHDTQKLSHLTTKFDIRHDKKLVPKGNGRRKGAKTKPQDKFMMVFSMENSKA